ncbi:MAG: DNA translocase FtsK [Parachlamydiaceae bacterium]
MARKSKTARKDSTKQKDPIPWTTSETRGFLTFACSIVLLLSLMSFAIAPESRNLLGLMGHTIGWAFHALFGLSSYLLVLYIGWIGWRLLFCKSVHFLWLKNLYVSVAFFSMSMLLSLIESDAPTMGRHLNEIFYPGLWSNGMRYHLGGAPFFYLYRDLPSFNLNHIFNTAGVALIFSSTLIASILFLFKIRLISLCQAFLHTIKQGIERQRAASIGLKANQEPILKKEGKKEDEIRKGKTEIKEEAAPPESDFMRFVKLRIPSSEGASQDKQIPLPSSADLLGIRPEKNLKERPSLSRKERNDEDEAQAPLFPLPQPRAKKQEEPPVAPFSGEEDGRDAFKKSDGVGSKDNSQKGRRKENALTAQRIHNGDFTQFTIPAPSLLTNSKKGDQTSIKKDLKRQAEVLEETLLSFGIEAKVGQINCGPTITSFEVHPAIGVKVQKIKTLDNDIALNMEAKSIRIIAPIPGKAAVGIEVPNHQPQEVGFKEMLSAYQQGGQKFHIPILLGQAVNGDYVMSDLTKMPHCIIAGATGSGKSVCINTIIMSILLNAKPDQIKLIMVDPKKVELTPYTKLPHMLAPVITESQGAAAALNWMVKEMENRYEILKLLGVRNIDTFNKRTINPELEADLDREIPPFMPYIVGIIDELADLMMVASQDIETPIARIAQMARAVGIHLILATQRPSREVITGLIKANFPTRISFKVASRVNSQIVLDETGAESLLGNGDMLFLPPGSSHLVRAQGAFIRDEDILSVVQHICQQAPPNYVIQSFDRLHEISGEGGLGGKESQFDSLYEQAKEVVLGTGNASTTFLQRKLKIGYARAASLMDQLERQGIVGPAEGSKPRKIFARKPESSKEEEMEEADVFD